MNTLRELCSDFQYELISGDPDTEVSDIVYNSKNLKPDTVFVCMEGARFDPHTLVPEAFQKGCRAFVVSKLTSDMEKSFSTQPKLHIAFPKTVLTLMTETI